jgi:hypothetical protein
LLDTGHVPSVFSLSRPDRELVWLVSLERAIAPRPLVRYQTSHSIFA